MSFGFTLQKGATPAATLTLSKIKAFNVRDADKKRGCARRAVSKPRPTHEMRTRARLPCSF